MLIDLLPVKLLSLKLDSSVRRNAAMKEVESLTHLIAAFGFLLSFYTNPWVELMGYQNAFGTMAAISAGVLMLWAPFFFYGKRLRHTSLEWPIIKRMILWNEDREVGE